MIDIKSCLNLLFEIGIHSLMVEGGSQIISQFVLSIASDPLLDLLIITIAPHFIGSSGIPSLQLSQDNLDKIRFPNLASKQHLITYSQFGPDMVVAAIIP